MVPKGPNHEREIKPTSLTAQLSPGLGATSFDSPDPLPGFDSQNTVAALQESVYVVLDHGPYQRSVVLCGILCVTVVLLQELALRLIGRPVDHWCQPPEEYGPLPADEWKNQSIPVADDGSFSKCTMYDSPPLVSADTRSTVVQCHKWDYDMADPADSIVSQFDLVCDRQFLYDLCTLMPVLGYALLAPVAGFASDRLGRRPTTIVSAVSMLLASIFSSFPAKYAFFVLTRILAISSANAAYLLTYILVYEVTGNARRPLFTLLHVAVASTIVPPFLGAISEHRPSWMLAQALLILPTAMFVLWSFQLNESPAWLLATWRLRHAEAVGLRAADANGVDPEKSRTTFRKIVNRLKKMERSGESTAMTLPTEGLLQIIVMRRRAVAVFIARFSVCAIFYGVMITDKTTGYEWEMAHLVLSTGIYAAIIKATSTRGIREILTTVLATLSICAVAEGMVTFAGYSMANAVLHAGTKAVASCTLSVVLCYCGEIFPTDIRSAGVSAALFFGGLGALSGTFVAKVSGRHAKPAFNLFAAAMALLSVAAIRWLPEVLVEKPKHSQKMAELSEKARKVRLGASLSPSGRKKSLGKEKSLKSRSIEQMEK